MRVSVVIPSYQRPDMLIRCLKAIDAQQRLPDTVIVVCRATDAESIQRVHTWRTETSVVSRLELVSEPGQIAALRVGLAAVKSEIVVFTDDDTIPTPDWMARLLSYYRDPLVGGVGGRDLIGGVFTEPTCRKVGTLTWYGRLLGNHHLGCNGVQEVDVLKGANASFRTHLVSLPDFFRGTGAEVHNEVFVCFRIRKLGYKLIYDPSICVEHYPAPRFDIDQRDMVVPQAIRNASFNVSVTEIALLPLHKLVVRLWFSLFVGQKGSPGLLRYLVAVLRREDGVLAEFAPTQLGQFDALKYCLKRRVRGAQNVDMRMTKEQFKTGRTWSGSP
ncbi:glycosyltransferase family 2 protein [Alicyclobacillus ferrooxydans]|uniref:glycosyltransferase family 2 protein n=1 Tax=Alicyclobacillus ferrooxydans TaxID=471514 RepID=UPI0006D53885|nr:glycosyltransferase [Alicyclobacillus ferrooxydans]